MAGLVQYEVSDDELEEVGSVDGTTESAATSNVARPKDDEALVENDHHRPFESSKSEHEDARVGPQRNQSDQVDNPTNRTTCPGPDEFMGSISSMTNDAALREVTLPPLPNLDLPASPSEPAPQDLDQKISNFLSLKSRDQHFNLKLAASAALKNPSLLPNLMSGAGLSESSQYATTLPRHSWDPAVLPAGAHYHSLDGISKAFAGRKAAQRQGGERHFVSQQGTS